MQRDVLPGGERQALLCKRPAWTLLLAVTGSGKDPGLRDAGARWRPWAVVWAHTPAGRGGSCFCGIATNVNCTCQTEAV